MNADKIVDSKVTTMTDLSGKKSKVLLLKNEIEIEAFKKQLRLYSVVVPKGTLVCKDCGYKQFVYSKKQNKDICLNCWEDAN